VLNKRTRPTNTRPARTECLPLGSRQTGACGIPVVGSSCSLPKCIPLWSPTLQASEEERGVLEAVRVGRSAPLGLLDGCWSGAWRAGAAMESSSSNTSLAAGGAMGIACAIAPGRKSANTTLRSSIFSLRTSGARRDRERSISEAAASMVSSPSSNATCGSLQAVRVPTRMPRAAGLAVQERRARQAPRVRRAAAVGLQCSQPCFTHPRNSRQRAVFAPKVKSWLRVQFLGESDQSQGSCSSKG